MPLTKKEKVQLGIIAGAVLIAVVVLYLYYLSGPTPDKIDPENFAPRPGGAPPAGARVR